MATDHSTVAPTEPPPGRPRLGLSSYTYPWAVGVPGAVPPHPLDVYGLLDRADRAGAAVLQIADNLPLHLLSEVELGRVGSRASELSIDLEVGTRGIQPDVIDRYLTIAHRLGSPILRVVVDSRQHQPSPSEVVALLAPHRDTFLRAGVTLAIENHDRFASKTLLGIVEDLGVDWVGICVDTVNSLGALEGPRVVVQTLGPLAVNLHVKDFAVERIASSMGFAVSGRPAGQGQLDIPWVLAAVGTTGHSRHCARPLTAVLELWTPWGGDINRTIATEEAWAAISLAYLAPLLD